MQNNAASTEPVDRLLRKLESIAELGAEEEAAIAGLPLRIVDYPANADIICEGDKPTECCLVLDGFVFRYKIIADGKRQILSFHPSGDIPDLQSIYLKVMDHSLATLVRTRVAFINHERMIDLTRRYPLIAAAFWRDTLIDAAIFREWMVGLGRRTALQRIAHLLCEMAMRIGAIGLSDERSYELPVTQGDLADATGLSNVHVNRTLTELRESGLILVRRSQVRILDWPGLLQAADFDSAYLHQRKPPAAAEGLAQAARV